MGDSHTRSYKSAESVATRIFLSQGRKNNFSSLTKSIFTAYRYLKVAHIFKSSGLRLAFVIGEPDIRFLCYGKWDVGKSPENIFSSNLIHRLPHDALTRVLRRINFFLKVSGLFNLKPDVIVGAGTPNPEMTDECIRFNQALKLVCDKRQIKFFSPQIYATKDHQINEQFIGYSVFKPEVKDHTHLSTAISKPFDQFIIENVCTVRKTDFLSFENWKKDNGFDSYFIEINNFETFKCRDVFLVKSAKKIKRFFKSLKS